MIEYAKTILPKVSFSRQLFQKELTKCINWVEKEEMENLRIWCFDNFGDRYPIVLKNAFNYNAAS